MSIKCSFKICNYNEIDKEKLNLKPVYFYFERNSLSLSFNFIDIKRRKIKSSN